VHSKVTRYIFNPVIVCRDLQLQKIYGYMLEVVFCEIEVNFHQTFSFGFFLCKDLIRKFSILWFPIN
jgi:hypothetical protein